MTNQRRWTQGARWLAPAILLLASGACSDLFPKRSAGEKLYRKHCADCHGVDGSGHTIKSMGDPNANLLDDRWRHPSDAASLEAVISQGLVFEHPTFSKLDREEVRQIVTYLLSLRGERRR